MCRQILRTASLAAILLLLAACGQDPDAQTKSEGGDPVVADAEARAAAIRAQTAGGQANPEVALSAGPVETTSAGGPKRSDGLWEMTSYTEDGSSMASQSLCVGAGSEDQFSLWDQLLIAGDCSRRELTRTNEGWAFETHCELMDMVSASKGTISGDFRKAFRVD
jgi:hypothetical protein